RRVLRRPQRELLSYGSSRSNDQGVLEQGQRPWKPPADLPAERRSGFYIELARAQLWAGLFDDSFESLKVARHIAPQHTREHRWAREDTATLRRLKRADAETLTSFAEWIGAL
ncbi:hypothetical protein ACWD7F_38395, partial [Streptomyces sp. NPDC005122]